MYTPNSRSTPGRAQQYGGHTARLGPLLGERQRRAAGVLAEKPPDSQLQPQILAAAEAMISGASPASNGGFFKMSASGSRLATAQYATCRVLVSSATKKGPL